MNGERERLFDASMAGARRARRWTRAVTQALGADQTSSFRLSAAVAEAVANSFLHGYGGRPGGRVRLAVSGTEDDIRVTVSDTGRGFDVLQYRPAAVEELEESGYGLMIMRGLVDLVELRSEPGQGTEVLLVSRRAGAAAVR